MTVENSKKVYEIEYCQLIQSDYTRADYMGPGSSLEVDEVGNSLTIYEWFYTPCIVYSTSDRNFQASVYLLEY